MTPASSPRAIVRSRFPRLNRQPTTSGWAAPPAGLAKLIISREKGSSGAFENAAAAVAASASKSRIHPRRTTRPHPTARGTESRRLGTRLGPFGTLPQHGLEYWPSEHGGDHDRGASQHPGHRGGVPQPPMGRGEEEPGGLLRSPLRGRRVRRRRELVGRGPGHGRRRRAGQPTRRGGSDADRGDRRPDERRPHHRHRSDVHHTARAASACSTAAWLPSAVACASPAAACASVAAAAAELAAPAASAAADFASPTVPCALATAALAASTVPDAESSAAQAPASSAIVAASAAATQRFLRLEIMFLPHSRVRSPRRPRLTRRGGLVGATPAVRIDSRPPAAMSLAAVGRRQ